MVFLVRNNYYVTKIPNFVNLGLTPRLCGAEGTGEGSGSNKERVKRRMAEEPVGLALPE